MTALSKALSRFALMFSAVGLSLMTLIICWQVFSRYVLGSSPAWTEQAALLLMLWFILFAAAAGVREGFHIQLTLLQDLSSGRRRQVLAVICHLTVLIFGLFMSVYGTQLAFEVWSHNIPTLGISRGWAYIPIALSGALTVFFAAERLHGELTGRKVEPLWS